MNSCSPLTATLRVRLLVSLRLGGCGTDGRSLYSRDPVAGGAIVQTRPEDDVTVVACGDEQTARLARLALDDRDRLARGFCGRRQDGGGRVSVRVGRRRCGAAGAPTYLWRGSPLGKPRRGPARA